MPAVKPPEFRRRAVELARAKDKPVAQIASDLGIAESCLRRWMKLDDVDAGRVDGVTSVGRGELNRPGSGELLTSESGAREKPAEPEYGGVLTAKWRSQRIPVGEMVLRATEDDAVEMEPARVEVSLSMWPQWLDTALQPMMRANAAHQAVLAAHAAKDDKGVCPRSA